MLNRQLSWLLLVLVLPVVQFCQPSVCFGWVKFYETEHRVDAKPSESAVHVEYRFANKGDKPVTILSMEPSCGCTSAELEKKVYQPSERGIIKVTFDVGERQGWHQKTIKVKTDDPKTPMQSHLIS